MKTQLIRWIVINQHPFTIVEEPSFISLVYSLCPTAKIPSADTIKRYIMNSYETNKEKVQLFLQNLRMHLLLRSWLYKTRVLQHVKPINDSTPRAGI